MKLVEKYIGLVAELRVNQENFSHLSARLGSPNEAQKVLDEIGIKIVGLERAHGLDEARRLVEHERAVLPQLEQFTAMLERYLEPTDLSAKVAAGKLNPEELESASGERSALIAEIKKSVQTLSRMRDDCLKRRKKFSPEVLLLASQPDPLSRDERGYLEALYLDSRGERLASTHLQKIPEPATV